MGEDACIRCGNEPLFDYVCAACGEVEVCCSDCSHRLDEEGHLYEVDEEHGAGRIVCSSCGADVFEAEPYDYCGWCQHQVDKDLERD